MGQLSLKDHFIALADAAPHKTIALLDDKCNIQLAQWQVPLTDVTEVVGTNLLDHVPMEQHHRLSQAIQDLVNINDTTTLNVPLLDGDGHLTWWSTNFQVLAKMGRSRILVMSGEETSACEVLEGVVTQPEKKLEMLLTALMDREVLELELDGDPETFSTLMLEFPPTEWHYGSKEEETAFKPGGYLFVHRSLFICPVEPSYGNIRLRRAKQITLRFHHNLVAMEAQVSLRRVWLSQGHHLIELSFPEQLQCQQIRSSRRVKIPPGSMIRAIIKSSGGHLADVRLLDLSPYGLSFQYPPGIEPLAKQTEITLTLHNSEVGNIKLEGQVCNQRETRDETDPNLRHHICGVEFFAPAEDLDGERLRKLVFRLFKRNLKVMAMKRGKFASFFAEDTP